MIAVQNTSIINRIYVKYDDITILFTSGTKIPYMY